MASGPIKISEVLNTLDYFKQGVNLMLLKRRYFIDKVMPILQGDGRDYYVIRDRKVLSKGGAERICQIYGLTASFEKDSETLASFTNAKDLVAFKCTLRRADGSIAGEGRGCASLSKNEGNENKTIKLASKSSFLDSVIRSTNISAYFTQDLDEMPEFRDQVVQTEAVEPVKPDDIPMATERQKNYLQQLIYDNYSDEAEREEALNSLQTATRYDASQMIAGLVGAR